MTNHEKSKGAEVDTELLHRYVDGDLTAAERETLEARAKDDPSIAARIEGLIEIRGLVAEAATQASDGLDANALFSRIEASLDSGEGDAVAEPSKAPERKRPELRVLPGGATSERREAPAVPPDVRRRRIIGAVIGALAVAAAAAIAFTAQSGPETPEVAVGDPTVPAPPALPDSEPTPAELADATRTEVLEVDFGTNVGTIFAVEGDEGQRYAVVWLDDEGNVSN